MHFSADGDLITIFDDSDVMLAIQMSRVLKLTIFSKFNIFVDVLMFLKCDSGLLKCLFLSKSPIALSRVCWGVY